MMMISENTLLLTISTLSIMRTIECIPKKNYTKFNVDVIYFQEICDDETERYGFDAGKARPIFRHRYGCS